MKQSKSKPAGIKKHWISFRLDDNERIEFTRLFEQSQVKDRTRFIKAAIFKHPLQVVTFNKEIFDYWKTLSNLQAEYRSVGVNYNQITKALHKAFTEKQASHLLKKAENLTLELIKLNNQIIQLTAELNEKWLQK